MIETKAPGKIILFGEHAIVYGYSALSAAIDCYAYVTLKSGSNCVNSRFGKKQFQKEEAIAYYIATKEKRVKFREWYNPLNLILGKFFEEYDCKPSYNINITNNIPKGCGSGSATYSAFTKALFEANGLVLKRKKLFGYVKAADEFTHKNSSGIDAKTVVNGGYILSKKTEFKRLNLKKLEIVVCDSMVKSSTGNQVEKLEELLRAEPELNLVFNEIDALTNAALPCLERQDTVALGKMMYKNHALLRKLNLSCPKLDDIINIAKENNCLGAKLTGAGGGGSAIILSNESEKMVRILNRKGYNAFITKIGQL